jgi:hypothetical protein
MPRFVAERTAAIRSPPMAAGLVRDTQRLERNDDAATWCAALAAAASFQRVDIKINEINPAR